MKSKLIISTIFVVTLLALSLGYHRKNTANSINIKNQILGSEGNQISNNEFSFAVLGDIHFKEERAEDLKEVVKKIEKTNPTLIFSTGDLLSSCKKNKCREKIKAFKENLGSDNVQKFFFALGNHDHNKDFSSTNNLWQEEFILGDNGPENFKELTYSFDYGNSHFVILSTNYPSNDAHIVNNEQLEWLKNDLARNNKTNTFIFFHESAFPLNEKIGESLDANKNQRDKLWKIIDQHSVTAVFSGHEHLHSIRYIDSNTSSQFQNRIPQIIVGNTSYFNHQKPKQKIEGLEFVHEKEVFLSVTIDHDEVKISTFSKKGDLVKKHQIIY